MRSTTRFLYFLMVLILAFAFVIPANADYAKIDENEEFNPIFNFVPDKFFLCLDYYCITDFEEYDWITEDELKYFFLNKVGYIPNCVDEGDYVTYSMLHGELKLEKREFTEVGEPVYPDISIIPDEAFDVWSLDGFYSKDWYSYDEVFEAILPYIDQDYTYYVSKDLSLFKFFINIEFEDETSYVYTPKKISVVSNNSGKLQNEDILISSKDLATLIYELYEKAPKYSEKDYYVFIPENVTLPEDPEDALEEDEEEAAEEPSPAEEIPEKQGEETEPIIYEEAPPEEVPVENSTEEEAS